MVVLMRHCSGDVTNRAAALLAWVLIGIGMAGISIAAYNR
jgi:hypothetical protein